MSITEAEARKVAHLARIAVADEALPALAAELNGILQFMEQLNEVDVSGVEPMTSVLPMAMKKREDASPAAIAAPAPKARRKPGPRASAPAAAPAAPRRNGPRPSPSSAAPSPTWTRPSPAWVSTRAWRSTCPTLA
mgnify:CR=1 FL=1